MNKWYIIFLLLLGVVLVVGSILLRVVFKGKYEIKAIDLVFILMPLLLVGVATGKLQELNLFGLGADFSKLWATEVNSQIENQISKVPVSRVEDVVEMTEPATKESVGRIPRLIEERTEALSFRLGTGRYVGSATKTYFDALLSSSYLRFVVVNDADNELFGMYAAAELVAYLHGLGDSGYDEFTQALNAGNEAWLAQLPGFVPASAAVTVATSKRNALKEMETLDRATLPVINESKHFVGTVERAKLTASLILAVTEKIPSE